MDNENDFIFEFPKNTIFPDRMAVGFGGFMNEPCVTLHLQIDGVERMIVLPHDAAYKLKDSIRDVLPAAILSFMAFKGIEMDENVSTEELYNDYIQEIFCDGNTGVLDKLSDIAKKAGDMYG